MSRKALSSCHDALVVERTFAWITQCRRLGKDYEGLPESSEAMMYIAMTRLMVRRLAAA